MGAMKLDDIFLTPMERIVTTGGDVLHAMKKSETGFAGFGEAYFSWVSVGAIKGWKRHKEMTMNIVVPLGKVRFVFAEVDKYGGYKFRVEEIGEDHYSRITVPPGFWFAFQGQAVPRNLVLNISSILHDPNEVERMPLSDISYLWT